MDIDLQWRYEQLDGRLALVADNVPNYRAEIRAVVPTKRLKMRTCVKREVKCPQNRDQESSKKRERKVHFFAQHQVRMPSIGEKMIN